jgi:putative flippase GtrA
VFALGLALTTATLAALGHGPWHGRTVELIVFIAANVLATILRFVAFRSWIFRTRRSGAPVAQEINL